MSLLWIPMVLVAAMAQTLRNATQSHLTALIGTMGATQVRFLYGLPFALVFFAGVIAVTGEPIPGLTAQALGFTAFGALAQIAATALMLSAMKDARFALATALIKTEPIVVAILAFVLIGDALTPLKLLAIAIATAGVLIISMPFGSKAIDRLDPRIIALAVTAGLGFGLAAIGFRGGVLALEGGSFVMRATTILVVSLAIQSAVLGLYLAIADRAALTGSLAHARASLVSGFLGALASQFWFLGFALTTAANVRTLALVEVLIAMAVSRKLFRERLSLRQSLGIAIMLAGVGLLIVSAA